MEKEDEIQGIAESLSPNERAVIPHLKEKSVDKIAEKTGLSKAAVLRSLEFLGNKGIIKMRFSSKKIVELGINGILYKQKGLPERRLISVIKEKKTISLKDAQTQSRLSDNEFRAALGALKKKALVNLVNGKIMLGGKIAEISKKTLEEHLLDELPIGFESLKPEQKFAVESLKSRKDIIDIKAKSDAHFSLTGLGKKIAGANLPTGESMIELLTPEILGSGMWRGKKFRRYDIKSPVPEIYGGKRHFVNQAIDYGRKIWIELGFKEMTGTLCQTGFWNFDALFTAQDHPVREIHDTFYINGIRAKTPAKKLVLDVKRAHEKGISGSRGWNYKWDEGEPKRVLLRTHTTCLSAHTLARLAELKGKENLHEKFFSIGKCFRNETIDWSHSLEFNQTEGIVIDKNANFRNLLGYLKEFFRRMGFESIKFVPSYFPYTEPSVEIRAYHPERKMWLELGGAGIFRPEVVVPLLGKWIPVLAWGPGFDRMIMDYYEIKDLRELYENNLVKLREKKFWVKC